MIVILFMWRRRDFFEGVRRIDAEHGHVPAPAAGVYIIYAAIEYIHTLKRMLRAERSERTLRTVALLS